MGSSRWGPGWRMTLQQPPEGSQRSMPKKPGSLEDMEGTSSNYIELQSWRHVSMFFLFWGYFANTILKYQTLVGCKDQCVSIRNAWVPDLQHARTVLSDHRRTWKWLRWLVHVRIRNSSAHQKTLHIMWQMKRDLGYLGTSLHSHLLCFKSSFLGQHLQKYSVKHELQVYNNLKVRFCSEFFPECASPRISTIWLFNIAMERSTHF